MTYQATFLIPNVPFSFSKAFHKMQGLILQNEETYILYILYKLQDQLTSNKVKDFFEKKKKKQF